MTCHDLIEACFEQLVHLGVLADQPRPQHVVHTSARRSIRAKAAGSHKRQDQV